MAKFDNKLIGIIGGGVVVLIFIIVIVVLILTQDKEVVDTTNNQENEISQESEEKEFENPTYGMTKAEIEEQKRLSEIEKEKSAKKNALEAINNSGKTGNLEDCNSIESDTDLKQKCLDNANAAKAAAEHKLQYCLDISDEFSKDRCSDSFFYKDAVEKQNPELCSEIIRERTQNMCRSKISLMKIDSKDLSLEEKDCKDLASKDKEYCLTKVELNSDAENLSKAINNKNILYCNSINNLALKSSCKDSIYLTMATTNENQNDCNKISDISTKEKCLSYFSKQEEKTIYKKAINSDNLEMCKSISDEVLKSRCTDTIYLQKAVDFKDKSMCEMIKDSANKELCSSHVQ